MEIYQLLDRVYTIFSEIQPYTDEGRITWFNQGRNVERYIFDSAGRNPSLQEFHEAFLHTWNSDDELGNLDMRDVYFRLTFHQYTFLPRNYQYPGMNQRLHDVYDREQRYLQDRTYARGKRKLLDGKPFTVVNPLGFVMNGIFPIDGGNNGECLLICLLHKFLLDDQTCLSLFGQKEIRKQFRGNRIKLKKSIEGIQEGLNESSPFYSFYRELMNTLKTKLHSLGDPSVGEDYINGLVEKFPRFQILVFYMENTYVRRKARGVDFDLEQAKKLTIPLIYYQKDQHVDLIINLEDFLKKGHQLCWKCGTVYPKRTGCDGVVRKHMNYYYEGKDFYETHQCNDIIKCVGCCRSVDICKQMDDFNEMKLCKTCNIECRNTTCLTYHQGNKKCQVIRYVCPTCSVVYCKGTDHVCGLTFCKKCRILRSNPHECRYPKKKKYSHKIQSVFYFFDLECRLDYDEETDKYNHVVNFINVQSEDGGSWDFDDSLGFFQFLEKLNSPCKYYFFAHNMGKYDGKILVDDYKKIYKEYPQVQYGGQKILQIEFKSNFEETEIFIRDSLFHLTQSLDSFTSTFNLDPTQFKKGFFPYRFNTIENQNYIGSIPAIEFFDPDRMSVKKRTAFLKWYAEQSGEYDFQKELKEYCRDDVKLLKAGLLAYRDIGKKITGICPLKSFTIASFAMTNFATNHYNPEKTPIYPMTPEQEEFVQHTFHGGRTDVRQQIVELTPEQIERGERIAYDDIVSLYPSVQFFDELPFGFPRWEHNPPVTILATFFGFAKVDYIVLSYHHHPIPLYIKDKKLITDLNDHTEIYLTSVEIQKMISSGYYRFTKVHTILHYEKSRDIFSSYVAEAVGGKTMNSRDPSPHDEQVLQEWYDHTDGKMDLRGKKFENNPGMKALFKLMANSNWGKFGQRSDGEYNSVLLLNISEMLLCYDEETAGNLKIIEVNHDPDIPDKYLVSLKGQFKAMFDGDKKDYMGMIRNKAIASMVTANARCRLWDMLNKISSRVLYHDTDSIIYIKSANPNENIVNGYMLGQWEPELKPTEYIDKFVCIGPKSYAYRKIDENGESKDVIKMKGVPMHYETSQKLTLESMKQLVLDQNYHLVTKSIQFRHSKAEGMKTYDQSKVIRNTASKGVLVPEWNHMFLPFGFERHVPKDWFLNKEQFLN
jgi:hypothetical protein